ncbi:winged helix-turn-helix domain-containing protein [Streptomyces sp. NPDC001795]|uniref:winged helix-turn-helix domain-containing protein n=1 Tax=unclassified Streptomyces TaxID=2593676 RepID=UPI003316F622
MDGERVGDGGGKEFDRVAGALRARIADETYPLNGMLPPQRALAEEFGVSRDTVQRVIRELTSEGWIESRRGSGSRVIMTQRIQSSTPRSMKSGGAVTVGSFIEQAFNLQDVALDVFTLTSESLDMHLRMLYDKWVRDRRAESQFTPPRVSVRLLLPSEDIELPYPRAKNPGDDAAVRERHLEIAREHTSSLRRVLGNLQASKLVESFDLQVHHVRVPAAFKVYLFNEAEALFGPYVVDERPIVLDSGEEIESLDVIGLGATLTHHIRDDDPNSPGSTFVDSMQSWFNSVWDLLSA